MNVSYSCIRDDILIGDGIRSDLRDWESSWESYLPNFLPGVEKGEFNSLDYLKLPVVIN